MWPTGLYTSQCGLLCLTIVAFGGDLCSWWLGHPLLYYLFDLFEEKKATAHRVRLSMQQARAARRRRRQLAVKIL